MSTPAHAVHTIHGTFSGIPSYPRRAAQPPYATYAGVAMDMPARPAPGLVKSAWRVATTSLVLPSCRRLSPPPLDARRQGPARMVAPQPVYFPQDNPFDDCHALPVSTMHNGQLIPYQRTRLASGSFAVRSPRPSHLDALVRQRTAQRLAQDREARCKAVAGILLNKVHAVGKPMRWPPRNPDMPRTYKRSRLSTVVTVDDL